MACGGFEALSCPPKLKLATEENLAGIRSPAISYMRCCATFLFSKQLNFKYMSVVKTSNQDIKLVDSIKSHPKFKKVMKLMKGETVETVETLLFEVISNCRASSKVL